MEYTTPLIQTKLQRPRLDDDIVSRPRLIGKLNRGLERPLTLIAAPAGYGKTTLAVSWLQKCPYPVAWLSLDDDDSDLIVFVTYIIAAIQTIFPDACPQTQSLGQAPQFPPVEYIATTLINEIADLGKEPAASSGPSFVLVLDDFHTIHNDLINQLMTKIVNNLPLQMHIVICSRIDPRLPLSRLRVHRQIVEIRTIDLCFSQDEVNTFLEQSLGEKQSSEMVALLDEKTEGWIAALRLAALSMRSTDDPAIYELDSGWRELPSGLDGNAIYLSGHNRSDDLFMFLKVQINGLKPNTTYQVYFSIDLANNTPEGMMGIGGSPGESVYVKAGAINFEPEVIEDTAGWLRMNIDKGNQASEGQDMINLGTLANPNIDLDTFTGEEYALMTLDSQDRAFSVTTDPDGNVWLIAGTDSGFEGPTTVYYDKVVITFTEE